MWFCINVFLILRMYLWGMNSSSSSWHLFHINIHMHAVSLCQSIKLNSEPVNYCMNISSFRSVNVFYTPKTPSSVCWESNSGIKAVKLCYWWKKYSVINVVSFIASIMHKSSVPLLCFHHFVELLNQVLIDFSLRFKQHSALFLSLSLSWDKLQTWDLFAISAWSVEFQ